MNKISGAILISIGFIGAFLNFWVFEFIWTAYLQGPAEILFRHTLWIYVLSFAMMAFGVYLLFKKDNA